MKLDCLQDARTQRIEVLQLQAGCFADEKVLTALQLALTHGHTIRLVEDHEEWFEFQIDIASGENS